MHFLLKVNKINANGFLETNSEEEINKTAGTILYIPNNNLDYKKYEFSNDKLLVLGDLVSDRNPDEIISDIRKNDLSNFGGFFYIIFINTSTNAIKIYSSIFNILPVYYYEDETYTLVSSKIDFIRKRIDRKEINKKYILERILFNYSFFNDTILKYIKLLQSNHFIEISNKLSVKKHFNITDYFVSEPKSGNKVLEEVSLRFIDSSSKYFPDDETALSFTSGFDGRTMVAIAKKFNKKFFTYSFGDKNSIDLTLPLEQAKEIGVEFVPIILDDTYTKDKALVCGLDMIDKTEGHASFARAHYRYAAERLSERVKYVITGNFGSELFRAFHNQGIMLSGELIKFFAAENNEWVSEINLSDKLKYLNFSQYKIELEQLISELQDYKRTYTGLEKSEFFYNFIFEEVFRKYFGSEIVMQSYFLKNRSPYLDPEFIKYLLTTKYAGVYSKFFTHNPLRRFKGQLPYSYIIKNSYPPLLKLITGKRYFPADLLTIAGKLKLIKIKTLKEEHQYSDPFSVRANYLCNEKFYSSIEIDENLFDKTMIKKVDDKTNKADLTNFINILSLNYYLNNTKK